MFFIRYFVFDIYKKKSFNFKLYINAIWNRVFINAAYFFPSLLSRNCIFFCNMHLRKCIFSIIKLRFVFYGCVNFIFSWISFNSLYEEMYRALLLWLLLSSYYHNFIYFSCHYLYLVYPSWLMWVKPGDSANKVVILWIWYLFFFTLWISSCVK